MAQIDLNSVPKFEAHGDPTHLGQTWKRWFRSFELFVAGKGVTDKDQKKALLLHCAGIEVQDIFYTLADEGAAEDDIYQKAVKTLDKHFIGKVNIPYERYSFRAMRQEENETVDQYIVRLRQKGVLCSFTDLDEQIRDQVIEKCRSHKLRVKLLEKGETLTLDQLRMIAKTMESVNEQAKQMENKSSMSPAASGVNRVREFKGTQSKQAKTGNASDGCFRCGKMGHYAKDKSCPARDKTCHKCHFKGHFAERCKTDFNKKKQKRGKPHKGRQVNQVQEPDSEK